MSDTTTAALPTTATAPRKRRGPAMLAPLGYRDYRLLFIGQLMETRHPVRSSSAGIPSRR